MGLRTDTFDNSMLLLLCKFISNTAGSCGGALYIKNGQNVYLDNISAIGNSNSAMCISQSNVTFVKTKICNNSGDKGGGIKVTQISNLKFGGQLIFDGNKAELGGAIYLPFGTKLLIIGNVLFTHNRADKDGGAIYAQQTNISINNYMNRISFVNNTAENGGAI